MKVASFKTWSSWNKSICSPFVCNESGYKKFVEMVTKAESIAPGYIEVSGSEEALKAASVDPVKEIAKAMGWLSKLPEEQLDPLIKHLKHYINQADLD